MPRIVRATAAAKSKWIAPFRRLPGNRPATCDVYLSVIILSALSVRVCCFSRHCAERGAHFADDLFCVAYAVSPRDPARFVVRKPCCARCIFPDQYLQWQIDSDCLRRLHQRRAAAGVAEDDQFSRRKSQSRVRRACGMIDSRKDLHPLRANFCFQSVHRLFRTEATLNAR